MPNRLYKPWTKEFALGRLAPPQTRSFPGHELRQGEAVAAAAD